MSGIKADLYDFPGWKQYEVTETALITVADPPRRMKNILAIADKLNIIKPAR